MPFERVRVDDWGHHHFTIRLLSSRRDIEKGGILMDNSAVVVQYDVRQRNTAVENYREAADKAIDQLREELETLDQLDLQGGLRCEFMMAGDGNSEEFK
eukprot:jgi/Bigna1/127395/aug1.4_g2103